MVFLICVFWKPFLFCMFYKNAMPPFVAYFVPPFSLKEKPIWDLLDFGFVNLTFIYIRQ